MACRHVVLLLGAFGCTERALEVPRDGAVSRDLAVTDAAVTDLASADFAGPRPNPCPAGTEFIYTIDENTTLSRFNPLVAQFFDVGPIACPADPGDTPNSMAVDRTGNGLVNFRSGALFRLDTANASCTATPYVPGHHGFFNFGMSFAQDVPGGADETLWVAPTAAATARLAFVDLNTFAVSDPIFVPTDGNGELTGDDKANLWGFFPDVSTPFVARIDKQTGELDRRFEMQQLIGTAVAWGFAAYQGNFYLFLQRDIDSSTVVYRLDGTTGVLTTVVPDTGRRIVGVGVATCAGNGLDP